MQKLLRKKDGFTLIELMIVVAIIGILAAIALPAFIGYVRRSKTSEATSNIKSLFTGATSYYNQELAARGISSTTSGSCTVPTAAAPATIPGAQKARTDFQAAAVDTTSAFRAIGFSVADPHYYQYRVENTTGAGCGTARNSAIYSFQAIGDLDGDAVTSLFELQVGSDANNELYRSRGFYVSNELE